MDTLLAVVLLAAAELDCYNAKTMTDVRLCGVEDTRAEISMQQAFDEAMALLGSSEEDITEPQEAFVAAQRAWLAYRKSFCASLSERWGSGSIHDSTYIGCMIDHAKQRARELSEYR